MSLYKCKNKWRIDVRYKKRFTMTFESYEEAKSFHSILKDIIKEKKKQKIIDELKNEK